MPDVPPTARDGASSLQKRLGFLLLGLMIATIVGAPQPAGWLALAASPVFLALIVLQLGATFERLPSGKATCQPASDRKDWPRYSILVPLYRETAVIGQLVGALSALDYPDEALEILFLLEADDTETLHSLARLARPETMRLVIVPDGLPRTKPRALNHGLALTTGTFVTVYDAEDIPDTDQLKQAVLLFEEAPAGVFCIQARLAIDNGADGWLALMMTIEYAALFDVLKPGLAAAELPLPLGGTSNHFRRRDLQAMGGWDPCNVTEDADLGLRIARADRRILDLASTTLEEAPVSLANWLGQRRRWLKGWAQTGICHARQPRRVIKQMGFGNWLAAMAGMGGMVLASLTFPFFGGWFVMNLWQGNIWDATTWFSVVTNSLALVIFMAGLLAIALPAIIGLQRRRLWHVTPWLLAMPIYLVLISLAAWLAMWDLVRSPFHWAKTEHGKGIRRPNLFRNRR